ncbi:MAG: nucleotidyltransferase domain-containing protein [Thermoclostridium sp.]|nr:nucleotidyltransferase domain-containing protein [Thermoclostridium sp.]
MENKAGTSDNLLSSLIEREKELNCLYMIDEIISDSNLSLSEIFSAIVKVLPLGWRFPDLCCVEIIFNNCSYQTEGFISSPIAQTCAIRTEGKTVGSIHVVYIREVPRTQEGYFLEKEHKLIGTVAERIGQMIVYRQMKSMMNSWDHPMQPSGDNDSSGWKVIIDFLKNTDHSLLLHLCRKLINYMLILGIQEASEVLNDAPVPKNIEAIYSNMPTLLEPIGDITMISDRAFRLAEKHIGSSELTAQVQRWVMEERAHPLAKAIWSIHPSLHQIIEELENARNGSKGDPLLFSPKGRWLAVGLISRILTDRPEFINVAKKFINYTDFSDICSRIIYPLGSRGKLGGKSAGLFLAQKVLDKESQNYPLLEAIRIPKTWYVTTDSSTEFLQYNNLEELNEQKYKNLQEIRIEYPNIIHLMKNAKFPPEMVKSLSVALDDFGDNPIIVRSSSVLEDQIGAAFSGKYKSLFLANQGAKSERLNALKDAIIEVYASVFSPDPIQYRSERGLLDIHEEMGIMIQEVVGKRAGKYFLPLFSGVAFSYNEYRWSPRIRREDGLIRFVPGLGTRAVDRLSDDFPVLVSPQQPGIRVNSTPEEIRRYAPKKIDVINLEQATFETVNIENLLAECGDQIEGIEKIVSLSEYDHIRKTNIFDIRFGKDDVVVTFDGVITETHYIRQIGLILKTLKEKLGFPIDVEFACDGSSLFLLQCRPQSSAGEDVAAPIPQDIPKKDIIFSANRYISNGLVQNISHIVYVDPDGYGSLSELEELKAIGRIIGSINSLLPRRQFILIGPGRWGSRGDIKLGVSVTYADICNTAALLEVARKKSGYMPELSFGTHFFQDLVEARIKFLPLYPDDPENQFCERYLTKSDNILGKLLPEYQQYEHVVKVIDVPNTSHGFTLCIAMNAELENALGFLTPHPIKIHQPVKPIEYGDYTGEEKAWRWRYHMAEQIVARMDYVAFGVKDVYLIGSTSNGNAGPGSDIDLIIHFIGDNHQRQLLENWLEGWSVSLAEMNHMKTGYQMDKMLDVHLVTDEDIRNRDSFAMKINHISEPAQLLPKK